MKKFFILPIITLVFSLFIAHAEPLESLEQAIKESDIIMVKTALENITLSDFDQACLIDLAQQIIFFRKSQLKCYYVGLSRRIKHPKITPGLSKKGKIGVTLLSLSCLGLIIAANLKNPIKTVNSTEEALSAISSLVFLVGMIVFGSECIELAEKHNRLPDLLREDFDNALAIKQLLLRHNHSALLNIANSQN